MKKWMILFISIVFLLTSNDTAAPVKLNLIAESNAKWSQLFPGWEEFDMKSQSEILNMYRLSPNKDLWFPDSFPKRFPSTFIIYPRNYLDDRIKTLLGNE